MYSSSDDRISRSGDSVLDVGYADSMFPVFKLGRIDDLGIKDHIKDDVALEQRIVCSARAQGGTSDRRLPAPAFSYFFADVVVVCDSQMVSFKAISWLSS